MASRYAHHADEEFVANCDRIAQLVRAASSPTAIDTYSLEKLRQVETLVADAIARVNVVTGRAVGF